MTTKHDFTTEEWGQLQAAVVYAGMAVIYGDMSVSNLFKETVRMAKAIESDAIPAGAEELVEGLLDDMKTKADKESTSGESLFDFPDASKFDNPGEMLTFAYGKVAEAAAIVDAKAGAEEAQGYKQWVMGIAQSVAEAGREGGFLGIGSVRVSDQEEEILAELSKTLGL